MSETKEQFRKRADLAQQAKIRLAKSALAGSAGLPMDVAELASYPAFTPSASLKTRLLRPPMPPGAPPARPTIASPTFQGTSADFARRMGVDPDSGEFVAGQFLSPDPVSKSAAAIKAAKALKLADLGFFGLAGPLIQAFGGKAKVPDKVIDAIRESSPRIRGLRPYITPEEYAGLSKQNVEKMVEIEKGGEGISIAGRPALDPRGLATMAQLGSAKKGWYKNSTEALVHIFGPEDSARFAAVLSATSPQISVQGNLANTLNIWKNWTAAGRPQSRKEILEIMSQSVSRSPLESAGIKKLRKLALKLKIDASGSEQDILYRINRKTRPHIGMTPQETAEIPALQKIIDQESVMGAWRNNTFRALTASDPHAIKLSGPKVDSFMRNLTGNMDEVTNDTWQARALNLYQVVVGASDRLVGGEKLGTKSPGYILSSAATRKAAKVAEELTGEAWSPAEVQETVWSWVKALVEKRQGSQKKMPELVRELTAEEIVEVPDFATLLQEEKYAKVLRDSGYSEQLRSLQIPEATAAAASPGADVLGRADPIARRLERQYQQEIRNAAVQAKSKLTLEEALQQAPEESLIGGGSMLPPGPTFTSPALNAVHEVSKDALPAKQWLRQLQGRGVKEDEIIWTGVGDWLKSRKGNVSKADLEEYLDANQIQIQEVLKGDVTHDPREFPELADLNTFQREMARRYETEYSYEWPDSVQAELLELEAKVDRPSSPTKFSDPAYQLPGGENYRELVLTLPEKTPTPENITPLNVSESANFIESKLDPADTFTPDRFWYFLGPKEEIIPVSKNPTALVQSYGPRNDWTQEEALEYLLDKRQRELFRRDPRFDPNFTAGHYDEPNIVAHIRFNERVDADGNKVLFIEEIQSDWAQRGRDQGFKSPEQTKRMEEAERRREEIVGYGEGRLQIEGIRPGSLQGLSPELRAEYDQLTDEIHELKGGVPEAPFIMDTNQWVALSLKRMVRWAADNKFDKIGWTTGAQQAARYDLSKQLDSVTIKRRANDESWVITGEKAGVGQNIGIDVDDLSKLDDYIGKELAEKARKDLDEIDVSSQDQELDRIWKRMDEIHARINIEYDNSIRNAPPELGQELEELQNKSLTLRKSNIYDGVTYSGVDLQVGGEGMKGFYDQIVNDQAKALGKKYGAKVEMGGVNVTSRIHHSRSFDVSFPYEIRDATGQPLDSFTSRDAAEDRIQDMERFAESFGTPPFRIVDLAEEIRPEKVWTLNLTPKLRDAARKGLPYMVVLPPVVIGSQMMQQEAPVPEAQVEVPAAQVRASRILEEAVP